MAEQIMEQEQQELSAEQLSELLQIRRDKLTALREAGKDPFTITKFNVTGYSGTIKETFVDQGRTGYRKNGTGRGHFQGAEQKADHLEYQVHHQGTGRSVCLRRSSAPV